MDHVQSNFLARELASDPALEGVRRFTKAFGPFMEAYFSPLRPVFSFEINRADRFQKKELWMLRDGAIPLAWFFESVPKNLAIASDILVHSSLGSLVPANWKKNAKYYELYSEEKYHSAHRPENLFLTGPINPLITSLVELDSILNSAIDILGGVKGQQVLVYCPVRGNEFAQAEEESFEFQYCHKIFSRFGKNVRFIHWNMAEHASFANTAVIDLNGGWILKDNSMVHHALRRGAGLLQVPRGKSSEAMPVQLSKYHGIKVSSVPSTALPGPNRNTELLAFYSEFQQKVRDPRSQLPWPKWYGGFLRASYGAAPHGKFDVDGSI